MNGTEEKNACGNGQIGTVLVIMRQMHSQWSVHTHTHSAYAIYSEQGSHSLLIWKFLSLCKIRHSTLSCCCYSYIITARRFTFARNLISNQIKSVGLHQQREVFWKTENTFYLVLIWLGLRFYYSIPLSWTWTHLDRMCRIMKLSWFYPTQSKWSNLCAWQEFPRIKQNNDALKLQWTYIAHTRWV